jgi:glycosyltransferase involved in cell wall biosynthesis
MKNNLSVSLIVTTYNRPDALRVVLFSLLKQSSLPLEIIVADDGSTPETGILTDSLKQLFSIPVYHCWQEDKGFRLSAIRNKAIAMSSGNYIVMIDGDMMLHRHFIRDHIRIATKGKFVQGRRVLVSEQLTDSLLSMRKTFLFPLSRGITNRMNACCCCLLSPMVSILLSKQEHTSVRGCNMGFWKKDMLNVNGFNEAFREWGREDSEFVVRMMNSGIKRKDLRLGGVAYHLWHQENDKSKLPSNDSILKHTIDRKLKYCSDGINKYL